MGGIQNTLLSSHSHSAVGLQTGPATEGGAQDRQEKKDSDMSVGNCSTITTSGQAASRSSHDTNCDS